MSSYLSFSELDSSRFGMRIARGKGMPASAADVLRQMVDERTDVAVVRVPAGKSDFMHELARLGLPHLLADSLVYYRKSLADHSPLAVRDSLIHIERGSMDDAIALADLAALVFADYPSHYRSNPYLDPRLAALGYAEWASNYLGQPGRCVLVARSAGALVGFLTLGITDSEVEIVLNGVHPDWEGRGVYRGLLRMALEVARSSGASTVITSTQSANVTVQRAWHREGFEPVSAYDTFHLNLFSSAGVSLHRRTVSSDAVRRPLEIARAIESYAVSSLGKAISAFSLVAASREDPASDVELELRALRGYRGQPDLVVGTLSDSDGALRAIVHAATE